MARLRKGSPLKELQEIEDRMEQMFSSSLPGLFGEGDGGESQSIQIT